MPPPTNPSGLGQRRFHTAQHIVTFVCATRVPLSAASGDRAISLCVGMRGAGAWSGCVERVRGA
eukprot:5558591-Prymnesium_polylepis.1